MYACYHPKNKQHHTGQQKRLRNRILIVVLILISQAFFPGCHKVAISSDAALHGQRVKTPVPAAAPIALEQPKAVTSLESWVNGDTVVEDPPLAPNIRITKTKDVAASLDTLTAVVRACQGFLTTRFGPIRYRGQVTIHFTTNPKDNARMTWKPSNVRDRHIYLNHLNLYRDDKSTLWDVIVHEMFHALYQVPELIAALPIFAIEAQASYAQYMAKQHFTDGRYDPVRIHDTILPKVTYMQCEAEDRIDLDAPFAIYGSCITDKLYVLGALLFAYEGNGVPALVNTLDLPTAAPGIEAWILRNDLAIPPQLRKYLKQGRRLPDLLPPKPLPATEEHLVPLPQSTQDTQDTQNIQDIIRNREVQAILKKLGYYTGSIDGILGPASRKAITLFQNKNQLDPTGLLDKPTLDILETIGADLGI